MIEANPDKLVIVVTRDVPKDPTTEPTVLKVQGRVNRKGKLPIYSTHEVELTPAEAAAAPEVGIAKMVPFLVHILKLDARTP